jgi:hypothetical protein
LCGWRWRSARLLRSIAVDETDCARKVAAKGSHHQIDDIAACDLAVFSGTVAAAPEALALSIVAFDRKPVVPSTDGARANPSTLAEFLGERPEALGDADNIGGPGPLDGLGSNSHGKHPRTWRFEQFSD